MQQGIAAWIFLTALTMFCITWVVGMIKWGVFVKEIFGL